MSNAAKLFVKNSAAYAQFRPTYPRQMYDILFKYTPGRKSALDLGCGTGQVTVELAKQFDGVLGVDSSESQVAAASKLPNVRYEVGSAHSVPVREQSVDLITIAQTMHWLDHKIVFAEAQRVLKPSGVLAIIGYPLCHFVDNDAANIVLRKYHFEDMRAFWHPLRWLLDDKYVHLDDDMQRSFADVETHELLDERDMALSTFLNYLGTSSARLTMREKTGADLLPQLKSQLLQCAGATGADADPIFRVAFPILLKLGRHV